MDLADTIEYRATEISQASHNTLLVSPTCIMYLCHMSVVNRKIENLNMISKIITHCYSKHDCNAKLSGSAKLCVHV